MSEGGEPAVDAWNEWERRSWERLAQPFTRNLEPVTSGSVPALLDAVGARAGHLVVDVGCGPGSLSRAALARSCRVIAVDVAEAMLAITAERAPGADRRLGSAEALPVRDGEVDAVCGNYVLPHVGDPQRAIAEALRALRPGGRAAFTEWDAPNHEAFNLFWSLLGSGAMPMPPDAPAVREANVASLDLMRAAFEAVGAVDVDVRELRWTITVDPGEFWDGVVYSTPRTGAQILAAPPEEQAALRARYDALVRERPHEGDRVTLGCAAILGAGTSP